MDTFYDELAPYYHLIYPDWESSIALQAGALDELIRQELDGPAHRVLDVSCGIGTQCLGLAQLGYEVTASDLSRGEIERAKREAAVRGLKIGFSVADMREAFDHHGELFDVVLSCDNSVPHLLSDEDIGVAFDQFYRCTRPGGICLISVRDYGVMELGGTQLKPHGVRIEGDTRFVLLQAWEFHGRIYELTMYLIEDSGNAECRTRAFRSRYYAVPIDRLVELLGQAGFEAVHRIDGAMHQPVIIGRRPLQGASASR
jgi:SAM-dependent methyltransferase